MCDFQIFGLCLSAVPATNGTPIFGFSEFCTALALLGLVFTQSGPIYRFRLITAPVPVYMIAFWGFIAIGVFSLTNDLWFNERWYSLQRGVSRYVIQSLLGTAFLTIVSAWAYFCFLRPARFGKLNAGRFASIVYTMVVSLRQGQSPSGVAVHFIATAGRCGVSPQMG